MEKQLSFLNKNSKKTTEQGFHIFVDGASRNNPGPSGAGVYITYGDEVVCKQGYYLGKKTNNQAEYLALLLALFITQKEAAKRNIPTLSLVITSDSELLVKQMTGEYRVKNQIIARMKKIIDGLLYNKSYTFKHVLRENNTIADMLANVGIDKQNPLPESFVTLLTNNEVAI